MDFLFVFGCGAGDADPVDAGGIDPARADEGARDGSRGERSFDAQALDSSLVDGHAADGAFAGDLRDGAPLDAADVAPPDVIAPDAAPPDAAPPCVDQRRAVPVDLPLILFYGFFQGADGIDDAVNRRLIQPGLDVTFGVANGLFEPAGGYGGCPDMSPTFAAWRASGARLAKRVTEDELAAWLADGSALARLDEFFRYGWDYVHIDELAGVAWGDEGEHGARLRAMLSALTARGDGRRTIIWFSPGTTEVWRRPAAPGARQGALHRYRQLFLDCQVHCRRLVFEAYPANTQTAPRERQLVTSTVVGPEDAAQYLERLAIRLMRIAEGTNTVSIAGLGLANEAPTLNYLDRPRCDLAPFRGDCPQSPGNGGLRRQFAEMHRQVSHNWRGVAFYTPARVHDTATYTVADVAEHLRTLTSWWIGR